MPEKIEGNNNTIIKNTFPVLHTIFFYWGLEKRINLPRGGQQNTLYDPLVGKNTFIIKNVLMDTSRVEKSNASFEPLRHNFEAEEG